MMTEKQATICKSEVNALSTLQKHFLRRIRNETPVCWVKNGKEFARVAKKI